MSHLPWLTPQAGNRHNAGSRIPFFMNCDVQSTAEEGGMCGTMGHVRLLVPGRGQGCILPRSAWLALG